MYLAIKGGSGLKSLEIYPHKGSFILLYSGSWLLIPTKSFSPGILLSYGCGHSHLAEELFVKAPKFVVLLFPGGTCT